MFRSETPKHCIKKTGCALILPPSGFDFFMSENRPSTGSGLSALRQAQDFQPARQPLLRLRSGTGSAPSRLRLRFQRRESLSVTFALQKMKARIEDVLCVSNLYFGKQILVYPNNSLR